MATEGTRSRRRRTEYTKDGPTDQERSPAKSSSPFIHAPRFLSFVRSFLLFLFFFFIFSPSYSFFLFHRCSAVTSFDVSPRGMCHTQAEIYERNYTTHTTHDIYRIHQRDLNRFDCFFDCELISRAKLLLRSHKRAWPRIEWLVMGVNYVQLYCVCARRIY